MILDTDTEEFKEDSKNIHLHMDKGHTYHCACRLVWGDGECECKLKGKPPGIISQQVLVVTTKKTPYPVGSRYGLIKRCNL